MCNPSVVESPDDPKSSIMTENDTTTTTEADKTRITIIMAYLYMVTACKALDGISCVMSNLEALSDLRNPLLWVWVIVYPILATTTPKAAIRIWIHQLARRDFQGLFDKRGVPVEGRVAKVTRCANENWQTEYLSTIMYDFLDSKSNTNRSFALIHTSREEIHSNPRLLLLPHAPCCSVLRDDIESRTSSDEPMPSDTFSGGMGPAWTFYSIGTFVLIVSTDLMSYYQIIIPFIRCTVFFMAATFVREYHDISTHTHSQHKGKLKPTSVPPILHAMSPVFQTCTKMILSPLTLISTLSCIIPLWERVARIVLHTERCSILRKDGKTLTVESHIVYRFDSNQNRTKVVFKIPSKNPSRYKYFKAYLVSSDSVFERGLEYIIGGYTVPMECTRINKRLYDRWIKIATRDGVGADCETRQVKFIISHIDSSWIVAVHHNDSISLSEGMNSTLVFIGFAFCLYIATIPMYYILTPLCPVIRPNWWTLFSLLNVLLCSGACIWVKFMLWYHFLDCCDGEVAGRKAVVAKQCEANESGTDDERDLPDVMDCNSSSTESTVGALGITTVPDEGSCSELCVCTCELCAPKPPRKRDKPQEQST